MFDQSLISEMFIFIEISLFFLFFKKCISFADVATTSRICPAEWRQCEATLFWKGIRWEWRWERGQIEGRKGKETLII